MSLSMTQFWLIAIALLLLVEFATSALTTIWFGSPADRCGCRLCSLLQDQPFCCC